MGPRSSHTVVYQTDPNLQRQINQLVQENKQAKDQLRKMNDPQALIQVKEKQLQNYLAFISKQKWTDPLSSNLGIKNNVIVGNISTGKSSLLNKYFGLNEPVGIDETTMEAKPVRKGQVTIWDSPGVNEDFDLQDAGTLKMFATADKIFVLFNTSLKSSKNQVRILHAVNPKGIYCVRTQCDKFESEDSLNQALAKDRQILKKWGINCSVFATSALNPNFRDNKTVKELMDK